jgi:glutaryl-CoA dehydrogenase
MLPNVVGLKGPLGCLSQARFGIAWGALGAARCCYDTAVSYARERVQFGSPIASRQLIQEQLVEMAMEIVKGQILALHYGRLKDAGGISLHRSPKRTHLCSSKRTHLRIPDRHRDPPSS